MKQTTSSRWRLVTVSILAFILMAGLASSVDARRGDRRGGREPRGERFGGMMRGLAGLDLTQDQRDAIREIVTAERSELGPLMERMGSARMELQDAIAADPVNEQLIRQKASAMADAAIELAVKRAEIGAKVRAELTEEQRGRLEELRGRRQQRARARAAGARAYRDVMTED